MKGKTKSLKFLIASLIAAMLIFIPALAHSSTVSAAETEKMSKEPSIIDLTNDTYGKGGGTFTTMSVSNNITVTISPEYKQSIARSMLKPLNNWRTQKNWCWTNNNKKTYITGLPALKYDYTLEKVAMQRAAEIALSFDHTRPNGGGLRSTGLFNRGYNGYGENIFTTTSSIRALDVNTVLDVFKEEDLPFSGQGHRRNMLSRSGAFTDLKWNAVGFACVKYGNAYYWVQIFGNAVSGADTKATTAVNKAQSTSIEVAPSMIKKKKFIQFTNMGNVSVEQGKSISLNNAKAEVEIGLPDTWPTATIKAYEIPEFSSSNSKVATIFDGYVYGKSVGVAKV